MQLGHGEELEILISQLEHVNYAGQTLQRVFCPATRQVMPEKCGREPGNISQKVASNFNRNGGSVRSVRVEF